MIGKLFGGKAAAARGAEVYLGAFGKHPGWDDHIDDLGLETERLVHAKRVVYVDGIGANIDSGAWDKLEPDQQVFGFGHVFVWRAWGDLVIGRLWSSRDGKGRTKYPMVVCAQVRGLPLRWALTEVLPKLEDVQRRCEGAAKASEVVALLDDARGALRQRAAASPPAGGGAVVPEVVVSGRTLSILADHAELGPGRAGLMRVLYQMDRDMSGFKRGVLDGSSKSKQMVTGPQSIRVPSCGVEPVNVLTQWMSLLLSRLAPASQIMLILPLGKGWVDAVVGEVSGAQMYCMRAGRRAIAPASEVPYTIDAAFKQSVEKFLESSRAGGEEAVGPTPLPRGGGAGSVMRAIVMVGMLTGSVGMAGEARASVGEADPRLAPRAVAVAPLRGEEERGEGREQPPAAGDEFMEKLRGKNEVVAGSPSINAAWREWRDQLARRYAAGDRERVKAEAERLEAFLVSIEQREIPRGVALPGQSVEQAVWSGRMEGAAAQERERLIARLMAQWGPNAPDSEEAATRAEVRGAAEAMQRWKATASTYVRELAEAEHALANGYGLTEPRERGTLGSMWSRWKSDPVLSEEGMREVGRPVLDRIDRLASVEKEDSSRALAESIVGAGAAEPELVIAAWRRLAGRAGEAWPRTADDLEVERSLRERVLAAMRSIPDRERSERLLAEHGLEVRRRFLRYLGTRTDSAEMDAAMARLGEFGVEPSAMDGPMSYNQALLAFKRRVLAPGVSTETARAMAGDFVREARGMPGGVAFVGEAAPVVRALEEFAQGGGDGLDRPRESLPRVGPLGAGFMCEQVGRVLRCTLEGVDGQPLITLEFVRVETAGEDGGPAYIGTDEVTVGVFTRVVDRLGSWKDVRSMMGVFDEIGDDRRGPRAWEWNELEQIRPARSWLPRATASGEEYVAGYEPGAPEWSTPMQHVPVEAAMYVSALIGCRLMTVAEWRVLESEWGAKVEGRDLNLRDQSWQVQEDHVRGVLASGRRANLANDGAFSPSGQESREEAGGLAWRDGFLWFAPGDAGGGETAHHIRGNVAEFATETPLRLDRGADVGTIQAMLAENPKILRVVGGSALSDPGLDGSVAWPVSLADAREGYADVGFRLAFSAGDLGRPRMSEVERLVRLLEPTPYVRSR